MALRLLLILCALGACGPAETPEGPSGNKPGPSPEPEPEPAELAVDCILERSEDFGPVGETTFDVDVVVSGLSIPWSIDWMPDGTLLVTERDGRLASVAPGSSRAVAAAQVDVTSSGEGGLLGLAIHPDFASNDWFYLYYTADGARGRENRVERWTWNGGSPAFESTVVAAIPARQYHNGGRLRFGPDGKLYIGTGDAGDPDLSQDPESLAGKLLRVNDDGTIPADNPWPGSAAWLIGLRNTQGFDWREDGRIVITDHGPSGLRPEGGRRNHDELNVAEPGDNLGWPEIYKCETQAGMVSPSMTWARALPPGGTVRYTGTEIPEFEGDLFIGVLGFGADVGQLHRVRLADDGNVTLNEVYLRGAGGYGRLRDVVMGPDGGMYVTTSNCDGRGDCGEGDLVLRIGRSR